MNANRLSGSLSITQFMSIDHSVNSNHLGFIYFPRITNQHLYSLIDSGPHNMIVDAQTDKTTTMSRKVHSCIAILVLVFANNS